MTKLAGAAMLGLSALALSGCASGLPTQVSRYQAMPAAQGQSFFVVPMNPAQQPGLEFQRYAGLVAKAMQAQGYAAATSPQAATMLVRVGYGVDEGETEYLPDTMAYGAPYGSPYYGTPYWGTPYYSRYGYYGPRSPYYMGWENPFMTPVTGPGGYGPYGISGPYGAYSPYGGYPVRPTTVYKSFLDLDIRRASDNQPLFEGHAKARSDSDNLGVLVPNLVTAMFTGFPGRSGEVIKITVPTQRTAQR